MFRDASTSGGLRSGHHAAAKAELATILPYGFLIAAALATGLHLVLAALHAPIRLLPLPEPGPGTQGPASSLLMAASVAALLAALGGLGGRGGQDDQGVRCAHRRSRRQGDQRLSQEELRKLNGKTPACPIQAVRLPRMPAIRVPLERLARTDVYIRKIIHDRGGCP